MNVSLVKIGEVCAVLTTASFIVGVFLLNTS